MKNHLLISLTAMLIGFSSCEKAFIKEEPEPSNAQVFDHLWETVDQKYSFFEDKNIDWDQARLTYRQQAIRARNSIELFNALADLLFVLEDGHVNLSGGIDLSRNWNWYLDYPPNYNWDIIERNYLTPSEDYQISGPLHNTVIDSVGYIHYESFSSGISTSLLDYIIYKMLTKDALSIDGQVAGLIIDVRNNGGGSVDNAFTLANRFAPKEQIKVADWYYKAGPEHNNFTKPESKYIKYNGSELYQFNKPIVILTNRSCYSATNMFASIMAMLPNVTLIGDKTGGGGGLPINNELPNGWRYRFSATRTIDPTGYNIEFGISPDIKIDLDSADLANGKDTYIERAIQYIKEGE
jgi:hypothetical protein